MAVRQVLDWITLKYPFTTELLVALRVHFPFMETWEPAEIDNSYFALGKEEEPYWLKMVMDESNTGDGIREVWVSDGTEAPHNLNLSFGDVSLHEVIPDGTRYIIMKEKRTNPDESVVYTYTLHGKETVVYPLERPERTDASQVAAMVARECGKAV